MIISLSNVRLAFPDLFVAKAFSAETKPSFGATFLIPYDDKQLKTFEDGMAKLANEKWGDKGASTLKGLIANGKVCFQDGAKKEEYAGYSKHFSVTSRSPVRPLVIDCASAGKTPLVEADGKPYGGCYVNARLEMYAQDNAYGKRINCVLLGVQFARHGDAFGGSAPATVSDFDDFDDVSSGADAESLM